MPAWRACRGAPNKNSETAAMAAKRRLMLSDVDERSPKALDPITGVGAYFEFSYQTRLLVGVVPMASMSGAPSPLRSATTMPDTATLPESSLIFSQVLLLGR